MKHSLVQAAERDPAIDAAALLGSSALGREDAWSDIDLALQIAPGAEQPTVVEDWTARMHRDHDAVDHFDVFAAGAVYRVFLLASTLQVDVSFWPSGDLRPTSPRFRLLFGAAAEPRPPAAPDPRTLIGLAWVYLLHVRSSAARGRLLQAELMLTTAREQVLALACRRRDLPHREGRGFDDLPAEIRRSASRLLVGSLEQREIVRVLGGLVELLLGETEGVDAELARRLRAPLEELATAPHGGFG